MAGTIMTLEEILVAISRAVGFDVRDQLALLRTEQAGVIGDRAHLMTEAKATIVAAINEVRASAAAANASLGISENRALELLTALKNELLNGAGSAWDTFKEVQDAFAANADGMVTLMNAIGNRVSFADVQTLTDAQKGIAQQNIGLGNLQHDFVAEYLAARTAIPV